VITLVYVALGGAVGALARYGLGGWVQARAGLSFPLGTLVVNVLGCVLIGFGIRYMEAARFPPETRALLAIGVLGAFTTFSTFSYETLALMEDGAWFRAGLYVVGSVVLGLTGAWVGAMLSAHLVHARP